MPNQSADWTRHAGDVNDTIEVEVSKALGEDLSAVTAVSCTVRHRVSGAETALSASVTDVTNRVVTVQLSTWLQSTVAAGDEYFVSLALTTAGTGPVTFPERLEKRPLLAIV